MAIDKQKEEVTEEVKEYKKFMRVSENDNTVIEEVVEIDIASFLAKLDQSDLDDDAEIARRNANKEATAAKRLVLNK